MITGVEIKNFFITSWMYLLIESIPNICWFIYLQSENGSQKPVTYEVCGRDGSHVAVYRFCLRCERPSSHSRCALRNALRTSSQTHWRLWSWPSCSTPRPAHWLCPCSQPRCAFITVFLCNGVTTLSSLSPFPQPMYFFTLLVSYVVRFSGV
jgi:hypothetical protein